MPTRNINNNLNVLGDGAEIFLKSADHNVARIIPRGTGGNLDKGLLSLFDTGTEDVRIDTAGNSWFNGGNIGIGQGSPTAKLHLKGDGGSSGLTFKTTDSSDNETFFVFDGGRAGVRYHPFSIGIPSTTSVAGNAVFQVEEAGLLTVLSTGKVGVGTTNPTAKFEVTDGSSSITLQEYSNGAAIFLDGVDGDFTGGDYFHILANSNSYLGLGGYGGGTTPLNISNAGKVGIGTTSPQAALHVAGAISTTPTGNGVLAGIYSSGSSNYGHIQLNGDTGGYIDFSMSGVDWKGRILYDHSSNSMRFDTNGTERMRINSSGNVGIGTTNPLYKLHIAGTTYVNSGTLFIDSGQQLLWGNSNQGIKGTNNTSLEFKTGGSTNMLLDNSGKVGIGATSPNSKLDVRRSGNGIAFELHQTSGAADDYVDLKMIAGNTTAGTYGTILRHKRDGSGGADFSILTNPTLTGTPTEKLTVKSGGNVGIGTTSPARKLSVEGSGVEIKGTEPTLFFTDTTSGHDDWKMYVDYDEFYLQQYVGDSSYTSRLAINGSGNVGIGTASPAQKLHVNGNVDIDNGGILLQQAYGINFGVSGYDIIMPTTTRLGIKTAGSESISILNTGKVGIGATNPTKSLDVRAEARVWNGVNGIELSYSTGNTSGIVASANNSGNLEFRTHAGTAAKMFITNAGNVGIGTTSPSYPLEVANTATVSIAYQRTGVSAKKWGFHSDNANTYWQNLTDNVLALTVSNAGNVGIGTLSPTAKITLADHTTAAGGIKFRTASSSVSLWSSGSGNLNTDKSFNVGSRLRVVGGNAAADPDIGFSGASSGTGFSRASNDITFITSATERMRINSSGKVLVNGANDNGGKADFAVSGGNQISLHGGQVQMGGTDMNWNSKFSYDGQTMIAAWDNNIKIFIQGSNTGSASARDIYFCPQTSGTGAATERMRITGAGNVGIGTSSPESKLHVIDSNSSTQLRLNQSGDNDAVLGSGTNFFAIKTGTGGNTNAISILHSNQNVGIGTVSPAAILNVATSFDECLRFTDTATTNANDIRAYQQYYASNNTSRAGYLGFTTTNTFDIATTTASGKIRFLAGNNAQAMLIAADGKVGIGTTTPSAMLEVTGSINDNWAGRFENTNSGGYGVLAKIAGTSANERIFEARVGSSTKMLIDGTGNTTFSGKVDFQGDAAIEGGSGYGVFKGYSGNDNHFIAIRGIVANSSTLSITGGHQTTFVEHADQNSEGWYFKSKTSGSYREIARIDGLGDMYLEGNQRVFADNYHPNADTLTTARTISLAGDVTGSVSFNGSSNVSITTAVANDSHTHDGRYYTESEVANHFKTLAVQGNFMNTYSWSGDTVGSANNGWSDFGSSPFSGTGSYGQNGTDAENSRAVETLPNGAKGVVWQTPSNDSASGADGGWNCTINGVDSTKAYRSVIYFRRTDDSTSGTFYHGCAGSHTLNTDGTTNTNPYFKSQSYSSFVQDRWYVSIGYIQPYQASGTTNSVRGGIYDCTTGKKVFASTDFMMKNGSTSQQHRTYLYYSTDTSTSIDFYGPRFEEVNGNEPSTQELVNKGIDGLAAMSFHSKYDPEALSQLNETSDANDDKFLLWDESASEWKYMRLDDLQDSIDNNTTYSVGDGGLTQKNFTTTLKDKLDDIELNAKDDQTAAEILAAIKTVDVNGTAGVNAGTFDGLQLHTGRNNEANKVVRTDGNGYLNAGWINTTSGDLGSSIPNRVYTSTDGYVRYADLASFRSLMNVSAKATYQGREQSTTDSNYWVGTMGWGTVDFDTIFGYGSGHIDSWGNPSNQPSSETSHWVGHQSMHYTNASSGGHYGHQFLVGAGNPAWCYLRGKWGGTNNGWAKMWNSANDGSGSGLDADLLDGNHASAFAVASHNHDDRYYTETETNQFLNLKANLASPALTGTPTAPTPSLSDNNTNIATTEYVKGQGYVTTDTNTTYSAGRGLDLSGTQFLLETDLRDSISYIGLDSNDYIHWSNNSYCRTVVNGSERLRVKTDGIDVSGVVATNALRTKAASTSYSLITRDTGASNYVLYVQSPNSGGTQKIVTFGYGSATAGQATEVFRIARGNVNVYSANLTVGGTITGTSKNFSIPHPTKEGKRLVHSCIEGPEVAVYFRGRSQSNTIEMPDYWGGLVDLDSMTVELTAIGPNQDLYVEDIADDGEVTVGSNTETALNYFYVVYGERKDIDKLEVEIDDTGEFEGGDGNSEEFE